MLVGLALIWGSSFMFIKIGVGEVSPQLLVLVRCALGAAVIWLTIALTKRHTASAVPVEGELGARRQLSLAALGAMTAAPFLLIAWGEQDVDSGLAGIVNASVPLWSAWLSVRWDPQHRGTWVRWVGVVVGFAGIVLLVAARGSLGGQAEMLGLLAVAAGALVYAVSGVYVRSTLSDMPPTRVAAWACSWAAALTLVPALFALPAQLPSPQVIASLLVLGVLATGVGFHLYYALLAEVGATRSALVTYLMPPVAVLYGAVVLDEPLRVEAVGAMALILAGVWLGSRTPQAREKAVGKLMRST